MTFVKAASLEIGKLILSGIDHGNRYFIVCFFFHHSVMENQAILIFRTYSMLWIPMRLRISIPTVLVKPMADPSLSG